jgi:Ca2+/Na+ antiporter
MLLGALWLVLAAASTTAGSAALGSGVADIATRRRIPVAPVRSMTIGLAAATATTLVASGRNQITVAGGIFPGAALFVLASAFGAALLLGRRPMEVREPAGFVAAAAGLVLVALLAADRLFTRGEGILLVLVFGPYAAWASTEPGRDPASPNLAPAPPIELTPHSGPMSGPAPDPPDAWPGGDPGNRSGGTPAWVTSAGHEPEAGTEPRPDVAAGGELGTVEARPGMAGQVALRLAAGVGLVAAGAFALVEGTVRVAIRAPLSPGFAGAAVAGSIAALPFALLVVFPRTSSADTDPAGAALTAVTGLVTLVPGLAAIARPYELDGPAAIALLGAAGLFALAGTWMLLRGRGGRILGALVLVAYAACLAYAGSL